MRGLSMASLALVLVLGACGHSTSDRVLSGAALGAAGGAGAAAIVGTDALRGAALGGMVGAAAGGLTNSRDVYLGDTAW